MKCILLSILVIGALLYACAPDQGTVAEAAKETPTPVASTREVDLQERVDELEAKIAELEAKIAELSDIPEPDSEREEIISFSRQALAIEAKRAELMRYFAGLGRHGQRIAVKMDFFGGVPPGLRGAPPSGFEGMASLVNKLLMLDCPQSMQPVKDTLIYIYHSEIGQAQLQQLQLEIRELQPSWGGPIWNLVYPEITKDNLDHWRQLKEQHGPVGAKHSFYKHMVETVWFGLQESRRGIYVRWAEILQEHGIDPAEL